ncbi:MAG TPA: isoprenylcysteine carboxylmethyltransferase family protein [Chitinophagaceae bacterium]|nr:isoprenylcysteine carboxylmethyltransferase family protein [Chitinophagaceae bacterium]
MLKSHIILSTSWILFCALHSVFASAKFKQFAKHRMRGHYSFYRLYYTLFALASFAAIMIYLFTVNSYKLFIPTQATIISGSFIAGGGFTIMSICIVKYFMQTSGLKGLLENRTNNELMITGVHKIVRHPLYGGTFIFIWGLFIIFPQLSLLIANSIITVYTLIGLRFEEKKLEKEFGEAYKMYKQKVPMIIPRFIR